MAGQTEKDFQKQVIEVLHLYGYKVAHFTAAQNQRGQWRTPVAADGKGFPDIVAARQPSATRTARVLFIELKTNVGRLSKEQQAWRADFVAAGAEHYVWRPKDWDELTEVIA